MTFSRLRTSCALIALACSASGCGSLGQFAADRGRDTLDMVPFSIATGAGVATRLRATNYFALGIGYVDAIRIGWRRRCASLEIHPSKLDRGGFVPKYDAPAIQGIPAFARFDWEERIKSLPIAYDIIETRGDEAGTRIESGTMALVIPVRTANGTNIASFQGEIGSVLDLEAEVFVGLIGIRVGLAPTQVFDWAVGWIGFDPFADDSTRPSSSTDAARRSPSDSSSQRLCAPRPR